MFARPSPPQDPRPHSEERGPSGRDDQMAPDKIKPISKTPAPSQGSLRGLDWFIFFLADVQTGFGPFVAVYLTTQKWTQVEIGSAPSLGRRLFPLPPMPGGAIVDAARSARLVGR